MILEFINILKHFYAFLCPICYFNLTFIFRSGLNGESASDCTLCNVGKYCEGTNNTESTGICAPGYYCGRGNYLQTPNNSSDSGICPLGKYCLYGIQRNCDNGRLNLIYKSFFWQLIT